MSWLKYLNPLNDIPEDPVARCGFYFLSIYDEPTTDPFYPFCVWDDAHTGSTSLEDVTLARYIQAGLDQLKLLQSQYEPGSWNYDLGSFYMHVWPELVGFFYKGPRTTTVS